MRDQRTPLYYFYLTGLQDNKDGDVYLATMLAIKLYTKLLEEPQMAFCGLYTDLESLNGLDRPGTVFLLLWDLYFFAKILQYFL